MLFIILLTWIIIIIIDYYTFFIKNENLNEDSQKCYSFNWHAMLLIFGIFCGVALGN